ncbi:MAG: hypothetical protein KatS3mg110_1785 [Pirellulaceae bacterium]|nr:MAG: hypothetical protein KatS3mg110_1785 [Pirellulaceae bacterium]
MSSFPGRLGLARADTLFHYFLPDLAVLPLLALADLVLADAFVELVEVADFLALLPKARSQPAAYFGLEPTRTIVTAGSP